MPLISSPTLPARYRWPVHGPVGTVHREGDLLALVPTEGGDLFLFARSATGDVVRVNYATCAAAPFPPTRASVAALVERTVSLEALHLGLLQHLPTVTSQLQLPTGRSYFEVIEVWARGSRAQADLLLDVLTSLVPQADVELADIRDKLSDVK